MLVPAVILLVLATELELDALRAIVALLFTLALGRNPCDGNEEGGDV